MMHKSFATINSPEFINLQPLDINPLMSKCEIKVLYLGENRNGTFISKEVATEMAKTLRGAPIVGYYKEEKEDFADHGEVVTIDDEGIHFECKTKPYGFVSPDAQVWFQEFNDIDDFGAEITREYLMTTGFLWTGQYEECKSAVEGEGKPHSMELDGSSLEGHWATNQPGMDFYIITDATFSKLCILGEDVEPCFEGSKVSAPDVSKTFTKVDDDFKHTLFSMMQDLKAALEGGQQMNQQDPNVEGAAAPAAEEPVVEDPTPATEPQDPTFTEDEGGTAADEGAAEPAAEPVPTQDPVPEEPAPADTFEQMYNNLKEQFDQVSAELAESKQSYEAVIAEKATVEQELQAVKAENAELTAFKASIESAKKDEMINSFVMLSDEDKQEVIANKEKYSVDEIEAKLSIICVRKKVNFNLGDNNKNDNKVEGTNPITTFNIEDTPSNAPAWIQAVKNTQSSR